VWAIAGCEGIGRHVAQRLLAVGEQVVDVPAKLSPRMRMFATGQGRKTDDTDAHSIALVGVRISGLQPVVSDDQLETLRLLVDRRRRIGQEDVTKICQLHQLLLELVPGGAKKDLSAAQARKILALDAAIGSTTFSRCANRSSLRSVAVMEIPGTPRETARTVCISPIGPAAPMIAIRSPGRIPAERGSQA
jgi:hypothetical protein